jgi:hypothetical protein
MMPYGKDYPDPMAEDGADLLDDLHAEIGNYVVFPTAEGADAFTLFIAATHGQAAWEHATRFVLKSPVKRCGKTRAQEVARELVYRPLSTTNISVAALVRSIDEGDPPTLIMDEADAVFGRRKDRPEAAEDLRGILNSGHTRGWPYVRWDPARRRREDCPTFAMAIIGGIGDMPDTIEDRAVVVSMRRRAPGERVSQFRRRRSIPPLHDLRDRLHAWVAGQADVLANAEPDLPVEDRDADKWEPLVAIADAAGGHWPDRARKACAVLCGAVAAEDATAGERLLVDLLAVFRVGAEVVPAMSTETILARLHAIDEAPWRDWYGRPLDARGLARLLKPYGVRSGTVRIGGETAKGYRREDLWDPWMRYGAFDSGHVPGMPASHAVTSVTPQANAVTQDKTDASQRSRHASQRHMGNALACGVTDVTDVTHPRPEPALFDVFCHCETPKARQLSDGGWFCRTCGRQIIEEKP